MKKHKKKEPGNTFRPTACFKHFQHGAVCPICKTDEDGETVLIQKYGHFCLPDKRIVEGQAFHSRCVIKNLQYIEQDKMLVFIHK